MIRREDLGGTDPSDVTTGERLPDVTPSPPAIPRSDVGEGRQGEVLRADFLEPLGLSARGLARRIGVPTNRITAILHGERAITAETAIRLGRRLGTGAEFWMNPRVAHDPEEARSRMDVAA